MQPGMKHDEFYQGKVCVVTGAASGIGQAVCLALGRQGALVVAADDNRLGAEDTARMICDSGGQAQAQAVDIAIKEQVDALFDGTQQAFGSVDYAFNIAGVGLLGEVRDLTDAHWQRLVAVNIMGLVHCVQAAYAIMLR